jgi:acyl-coenzyme A thioesterase PaaI-like protein
LLPHRGLPPEPFGSGDGVGLVLDEFQSTMSLSVSFLRPVRPGRITATGRIVHRDGDLAFLEATLADSDGAMIATATATARVISVDQARSAA